MVGIFCATFFHFYAHDTTGPIGNWLRNTLIAGDWLGMGNDPKKIATVFIGLFMQVMGILQIPAFLGPSFTPFGVLMIGGSNTQQFGPAPSPSRTPSPPAAKQKTIASREMPAVSTTRAEQANAASGDEGDAELTTTKSSRKRKNKKKTVDKHKGE